MWGLGLISAADMALWFAPVLLFAALGFGFGVQLRGLRDVASSAF